MKTFIYLLALSLCSALTAEVLQFSDANGIEASVAEAFPGYSITDEAFDFYSPKLKHEKEQLGLILYIPPGDRFQIPLDWKKICQKYRLALIAPRNVGNQQKVERRIAVSVLGTLQALEAHQYDEDRVYLFGYSGGGRMASRIMFYFPEIYDACLGICGFDYNRRIDFSAFTKDSNYGFFPYSGPQNENRLKQRKLAVISGPSDFRYRYLREIVNKGYKQDGYTIQMFQYEGYG